MKINNKRWLLFEIDEYLTDVEKRNCFNLVNNIEPTSIKISSPRIKHSSKESAREKKKQVESHYRNPRSIA